MLPLDSDDTPLERRIDAVERFYAGLGLPARYQMSPAAAPAELDEVLEQRGYRYDAPVGVFVAGTAVVVERTREGATAVSSDITDEWIDEYAVAHGDDDVARRRLTAYGRLLRQIDPPVAAVTARVDGALVGIGLGCTGCSGWVGVCTRWARGLGEADGDQLRRRDAGSC